MEQWRQSIILGNQSAGEHKLIVALMHYHQAKLRAESLFSDWFNPEEAVAAVVISYHSLADFYSRKGKPKMAERELRRAYYFMSEKLDVYAGSMRKSERKAALLYGQKQTYMALLSHLNHYQEGTTTTNSATIYPFV